MDSAPEYIRIAQAQVVAEQEYGALVLTETCFLAYGRPLRSSVVTSDRALLCQPTSGVVKRVNSGKTTLLPHQRVPEQVPFRHFQDWPI